MRVAAKLAVKYIANLNHERKDNIVEPGFKKLSSKDAELLFKYSREEIIKKELPDEVFESIERAKSAIEYFITNYDS